MHDSHVGGGGQLTFDATVGSALAAYLEPITPAAALSTTQALTALAFAEAPGLPAQLWRVAIEALYGVQVSDTELSRFARSSAANFLVESGTAGTSKVFRLFHQALNDSLLSTRSHLARRGDDEHAIARAFIARRRGNAWENAPEYLLRSLPGHAATAGLIDDLLFDDTYLLYTDLQRLMLAADLAVSPESGSRIQLLGLTPEAAVAGSSERAAVFSGTPPFENLRGGYQGTASKAPYLARGARNQPKGGRAVLESLP